MKAMKGIKYFRNMSRGGGGILPPFGNSV